MFNILSYKVLAKGTMRGFVDVEIPKWGNFQIFGITLFEKNGQRWISFPSRKDDKDGETKYYQHCKFSEKNIQNAFQDKLFAAIDEWLKTNQPQQIGQPPQSNQSHSYKSEPSGEIPF